jgi:hypothetical protein
MYHYITRNRGGPRKGRHHKYRESYNIGGEPAIMYNPSWDFATFTLLYILVFC